MESHYEAYMVAEPVPPTGAGDDATGFEALEEQVQPKMKEKEFTLKDVMKKMAEILREISELKKTKTKEARREEITAESILKKIERLEKEQEEKEDEEEETLDIETAMRDKLLIRGRVQSWLIDRGFGFMMIQGKRTFVHARAVQGGADSLLVGSVAMVRVVRDGSQGADKFRALEAWTLEHWRAEQDIKIALKRAETSKRAAAIASRSAALAAEATAEVLQKATVAQIVARPPGLMYPISGSLQGGGLAGGAGQEGVNNDRRSPSNFNPTCSNKPVMASVSEQVPLVPWPEITVHIGQDQVEELIKATSRYDFTDPKMREARLKRTRKARWLLENFNLSPGDTDGKVEVKVRLALITQLEAMGRFREEESEINDGLEWLEKKNKDTSEKGRSDNVSKICFLNRRATALKMQQRWREALSDWQESSKLSRSNQPRLGKMGGWGEHSYGFVEAIAHNRLQEWQEAHRKAKLVMEAIGEDPRINGSDDKGDVIVVEFARPERSVHSEDRKAMRRVLRAIISAASLFAVPSTPMAADPVKVYKDLVVSMYQAHSSLMLSDQLDTVERLMTEHKGQERTLYLKICEKYRVAAKPEGECMPAAVPAAAGAPAHETGDPNSGSQSASIGNRVLSVCSLSTIHPTGPPSEFSHSTFSNQFACTSPSVEEHTNPIRGVLMCDEDMVCSSDEEQTNPIRDNPIRDKDLRFRTQPRREQEQADEVAGVFEGISKTELELDETAQNAVLGLPVGKAAEILARVSSGAVKNPSRYVTVAARRYEREVETESSGLWEADEGAALQRPEDNAEQGEEGAWHGRDGGEGEEAWPEERGGEEEEDGRGGERSEAEDWPEEGGDQQEEEDWQEEW
jgi:cold shock CspA family protein